MLQTLALFLEQLSPCGVQGSDVKLKELSSGKPRCCHGACYQLGSTKLAPSSPNTRFRDRHRVTAASAQRSARLALTGAAVHVASQTGTCAAINDPSVTRMSLKEMPGVRLKVLLLPSNQASRINIWD